jgi:hypothetical protein
MTDFVVDAVRRSSRPEILWRSRLDGEFFSFRMKFNSRSQTWMLDVGDITGASAVHGLRVVTGVDVLAPYHYLTTVPPGQLFVVDLSGQYREPGRTSFREDHELRYRPAADALAALGTVDGVL